MLCITIPNNRSSVISVKLKAPQVQKPTKEKMVEIFHDFKEIHSYFLYEQCREGVKFIPDQVGCIFPGRLMASV